MMKSNDHPFALDAHNPLHDGFIESHADSVFGAANAPAPGAASRRAITPRLLLQYKWSMLLVLLVVLVPGVYVVMQLFGPVYRAVAMVEIEPNRQAIVFDTDENGVMAFFPEFVSSQIRKIRSNAVLERVLERAEVQGTTWYQGVPDNALQEWIGIARPQQRLIEDLEVFNERKSPLIQVAFKSAVAQDAAIVANAVKEEYLAVVQAEHVERERAIDEARQAQERQFESEIRELENKRDEYRKIFKVYEPGALASEERLRLSELEARASELQLQISNEEERLTRLRKATPQQSGDLHPPEGGPQIDFELDDKWSEIHDELRETEYALEDARTHFGERNPKCQQLARQIERLKQALVDREGELRRTAALSGKGLIAPELQEIRQVEDGLIDLRNQHSMLATLIDETAKTFDQTLDHALLLGDLNREIERKRDYYETVKRRREVTRVERFAPGAIQDGDDAIAPSVPYEDQRKKMLLAVVFGGLFASLAMGIVRALMEPSVQAADEFPTMGRAPFLGSLPLTRKADLDSLLQSTEHNEHIRMIRTALLERLNGKLSGVLQVTSAGPGVGKSTVSLLLARSLAGAGKRVLLIDGDLRRPALSRWMNAAANQPGLADCLSNGGNLDRAIVSTSVPGMSMIPAGTDAARSRGELLARDDLSEILLRLRERADIVLIDSSPLLPVADARMTARCVDGSIMVIRERHCQRTAVMNSLACLGASGGKVLGFIYLARPSRMLLGGYQYPSYYGYGDSTADASGEGSPPDGPQAGEEA